MEIKLIEDALEKEKYVDVIINQLTDWFEVEEPRLEYIKDSRVLPTFISFDNDKPVGFICLKETSKYTMELHVMGVLKEYHRNKLGTKLFEEAKKYAKNNGYEFLQVKTVEMGYYSEYDQTNYFYKSLGFKELEVIKEIWDEKNPCQIYIMHI